ncbi:hypothetical protein [Paraburkholderia sp.]|uniref:hypothetical protein n=1 Tax=Paraburkholderia sp. TaxID=1926495 RepID=UPI002F3FFC45
MNKNVATGSAGALGQMPPMPAPDAKGDILPEFLPGFCPVPGATGRASDSAPPPFGATIRGFSFVFISLSLRP